jgi:hypothetical protein
MITIGIDPGKTIGIAIEDQELGNFYKNEFKFDYSDLNSYSALLHHLKDLNEIYTP